MMEHHYKLGAYRGPKDDQEWRGIPIAIHVGDDYQLPSIDFGAIHIFYSTSKQSFITVAGESFFLEFAENVMKLDDSKIQHGDQASGLLLYRDCSQTKCWQFGQCHHVSYQLIRRTTFKCPRKFHAI
jgi:hypothetical protein